MARKNCVLVAVAAFFVMRGCVDAQIFSGSNSGTNTRCYTCVSDSRGYDYNYCRMLDSSGQYATPPSYNCPSGRCVKMDVVYREEVYPRTYRFCDYDGLVTNIGGDQYSSQSGFDRIGQQVIQPNQCAKVEARTVINSLVNVASRVRASNPSTQGGQQDQRYSNNNSYNNNNQNNYNNNNDRNNNNNYDNNRQRDYANDNRNNYNNNNNQRPYVSGSSSTYDGRTNTYSNQNYDSRYDNNNQNSVNRFSNSNSNPNSFDNRNSFSNTGGSGLSGSSSSSGVFDPSRNNYNNDVRYNSASTSSSGPGIFVNDQYGNNRRNKRQSSSSNIGSISSTSSNYIDGRGASSVAPVFAFDDLRLEQVEGMRVCRCDYDMCNGGIRSYASKLSLVLVVMLSLVTFFTNQRFNNNS